MKEVQTEGITQSPHDYAKKCDEKTGSKAAFIQRTTVIEYTRYNITKSSKEETDMGYTQGIVHRLIKESTKFTRNDNPSIAKTDVYSLN